MAKARTEAPAPEETIDADALAAMMNGGDDSPAAPDYALDDERHLPFIATAEAKASEGRIVHYVAENGRCKAAIIVKVNRQRGPDVQVGEEDGRPKLRTTWLPADDGSVNLLVFYDGSNDQSMFPTGVNCLSWKTSVHYQREAAHFEDNPRDSWHWPERV